MNELCVRSRAVREIDRFRCLEGDSDVSAEAFRAFIDAIEIFEFSVVRRFFT